MIVKYCNKQFNPKINLTTNLRLGTVTGYANEKEGSGISDKEEGVLRYYSDEPFELTPEISQTYLNNSITSNRNGEIKISPGLYGDAQITFALTNDVGPNGYLKIHPKKEEPLSIVFNQKFFIFSMALDFDPSIKQAKNLSANYDSFYEIKNIHAFAMRISNELSRAANCPVGFKCSRVNYDLDKFIKITNTPDDLKIEFQNRVFQAILNKNTEDDHRYQNEIRLVFWFEEQGKSKFLSKEKDYIDIRPRFIRKAIGSYSNWQEND